MNLGKVVLITGVFSTTLVKSFMGIQNTSHIYPSIYNAFYDLTDAEYSDRLATTITLISQEIIILTSSVHGYGC